MKIHLISDTHFGHLKAIEFGRPQNFEKIILRNLFTKTNPGDTIVHLGDFAFGNEAKWMTEFVKATPDRKRILVLGNHDQKSASWFTEYGFDLVCDSFSIHYSGEKILFTHIPENYPTLAYTMNIHGHLHTRGVHENEFPFLNSEGLKHKLISCEIDKCAPVELLEVIHRKTLDK